VSRDEEAYGRLIDTAGTSSIKRAACCGALFAIAESIRCRRDRKRAGREASR